jgi:hypothetical protein
MDWMTVRGLRIRGSITIPADANAIDLPALARAVRRRLEDRSAKDVSLDANGLRFYGPSLFGAGSNWNVLLPIDSGELLFDADPAGIQLRYRLGYTRLLVAGAIMASLMGAAVGVMGPSSVGPSPFAITMIVFLWLFGMNFLVSVVRVRSFLFTSAMKSVPEAWVLHSAQRPEPPN